MANEDKAAAKAAEAAAKAETEAKAKADKEAAEAAEKLKADAAKKDAHEGLVKVTKHGEILHVHPSTLHAHKEAGWHL